MSMSAIGEHEHECHTIVERSMSMSAIGGA
jgi:hypothetical protein